MKIKQLLSAMSAGVAFTLSVSFGVSAQTSTAYSWDSIAIGGGGFVSAVIPSKTEQGMVYARTDVGGAYRWDKTAARWVSLLDWVSEDEVSYLGAESLAVDPKNAANIYILAGISYFNNGKTAILRSTDYGKTFAITDVSAQFKAHGNGMGRQNGEKLVVDPGSSNILYAGTRSNGLFKSTNSGVSWSRLSGLNITTTPNENGISFVVLDPLSVSGSVSQRVFVGVSRFGSVGANFYRSNDAGATFSAVAGAPTTLMPQRAALAGDGNLYVTYANGAGPHAHWSQPEPMTLGQVWKYNVSSGAWANVTPSGYNSAFGGISVDPNNAQRLLLSTINTYMQQGDAYGDRIFVSTNGGASWTDVIARGFAKDNGGVSWVAGNSIHWAGSAEFDPFDTKAAWVTSGNGIFKTSNIDATTATWTFNVKGLEETVPLNLVSIAGGPVVSVIGDYDGFRHSDVSQYAPTHSPRIGTTTGLDVAALNTSIVVRSGGGDSPAIYYSTDTGASWTKSATMNGKNGQLALSANGSVLLHNPADSTTTYRSTNFGASWAAVAGLTSANIRPVADSVNTNKFYAYNNGSIMVSTDAGVSFSAKGSLAAGGSSVIRVAPGKEGDVWVPLYGGGLARSTNSGASFTSFSNVSYCGAVGFGKAAPGATYPTVYIWGTVSGVRGVWRSTDTGASWVRINDDAHEYGGPANGQFVVGDMNTYGVVYMSTAGRGVVYGKPNSAAASSLSSSTASSLSGSTKSSLSSSAAGVSSSASLASSKAASSVASSSRASVASSSLATSASVSSKSLSSVSSAKSSIASSVSTSSAASSASSAGGTANKCAYVISSQWSGGFNAAIRITNNKATALNAWSVSWAYSDGSKVTGAWGASLTGANPYTASNLSYNGTIQPGQTVEIGFSGTSGGATAAVPVVTGAVCN